MVCFVADPASARRVRSQALRSAVRLSSSPSSSCWSLMGWSGASSLGVGWLLTGFLAVRGHLLPRVGGP